MYLQQMFGLDGRTAFVTRGSSGIGRAIALALAGAGATVLVAARTRSAIDATVAEIRADGGSADGIVADLSTRAGTHALADDAGDVDVPFVLGQRLAPGMARRGYGG